MLHCAMFISQLSPCYVLFKLSHVSIYGLQLSPLITYLIRTLCIREVAPFCLARCSKSYYKSCSFQSLQKVTRCTKSVSNTAFHLYESHLPLFFFDRQTLGPNTFHLILWCVWQKVFAIATVLQEFTIIVKYCL